MLGCTCRVRSFPTWFHEEYTGLVKLAGLRASHRCGPASAGPRDPFRIEHRGDVTNTKTIRRFRTGALTGLGVALCAALLLSGAAQAASPALEEGFAHPPDSARPHTWWHWLNGNVTREGITADLEAMQRVGVGGAQIFDVAPGIPAGRVDYMTPEWRAMVKHAVQEADRLGLELCIHNCAGWSSSGGPWITPQYAMQMVTVSEAEAKGPAHFATALPQPPTRLGYYRDIAVLAFPTPADEATVAAEAAPTVSTSAADLDVGTAFSANPDTQVALPLRGVGESQYLQFEFPRPFTARGLSFIPGGRSGARGEVQVSDDGATFKKVADFGLPEPEITGARASLSFAPVTGRFYRLQFTRSGQVGGVVLSAIRLVAGFRLSNWAGKAGYFRMDDPDPDTRSVPAEGLVKRDQILDLTGKMDATGTLTWDVPGGSWTILRLGYTPTGVGNEPASESGRGLECDKLSAEAMDVHFAGMLAKIIGDLGPLAGKTLNNVLIDSYEVGCQNWTLRFRQEFEKRRGYDPFPYLPVMTGRVIDSVDSSERFLWDLRRTLADLYADSYYGHLAELCHQHGMKLSTEPYGSGNFDCLQCGSRADIPMSEFWAGGGNDNQCSKLASSAAHVWGRKFVGAESFTAGPEQGRWLNHPYSLKPLGDLIYCGGVNRFIFHRYAQQPWLNLKPGMTMGPFGFEFERTVTWWDQGAAWLQYLARCQYLLQEGKFVADLCYLVSEGAPNDLPSRQALRPEPPTGYDYDGCEATALLTRMAARDGRLVLPDGMSYRVLVLPDGQTMTPELLRKVAELVRQGATIVGPKPLRSPSLRGQPDSDREVQALADEVWGPCDGKTVTEHACGKGSVIWGEALADVLQARGVGPDFQYTGLDKKTNLVDIHRLAAGADVYFVSNQMRQVTTAECTFRGEGRLPELWHPDSGQIERAPVYRMKGGQTTVTLRFDPAGSVFVVFRKPAEGADPIVALQRDGASVYQPMRHTAPKVEIRKAVYGVFTVEPPGAVDVTRQLQALVRDGTLTVRADNSIAGDPAVDIVKQLRVEYTANGKQLTKAIGEGETLRLPEAGEQPGTLEIRRAVYGLPGFSTEPSPEPTVDVTAKLAAMVGPNGLSVVADNTLAGDPAPEIVKQMRVDYLLDGKPYSRTVAENETLEIPDGTEGEGEYAQLPPPDIALSPEGGAVLTAWEPGTYEADTARGRKLRATVGAVPPPVSVNGPWELRFPPKWGAPDKVTLPELVSWTDSEVPGVKYFSGTATYGKNFEVPKGLLAPGNVLVLDLGRVHEIAQVRLNGKDLGIVWKPPFEVNVTGLLKAGANRLDVQVTNLWPNRLIGDEQLPEDADFAPDGSLRAWPAWLLEGKPCPSGRFTFATWKHYSKDSPLLESGLLGPVQVRVGRRVKLGR